MSLFNETVARAARAEKALDLANERIANLEIALKAAMRDKLNSGPYYGKRNDYEREIPGKRVTSNHNELNTLSDSDVEEMFKAKMAEQADAADLKSAANGVPVRSRLLAPVAWLLRQVAR